MSKKKIDITGGGGGGIGTQALLVVAGVAPLQLTVEAPKKNELLP